jgi:hypothetical protein
MAARGHRERVMATGGQRTARSTPGPLTRGYRAWRGLAREQRVSALAALSLWVTMFLPWYSENGLALSNHSQPVSITLTAFDAFSFVELAVLLVSVAVLALLFARGERRAFHLPGGDGTVILVAGAWVGLLIFYRMLDKSSLTTNGKTALLSTGIQWGIFLALGAAVWLAWTGLSMRRSHRAEPALTDDPTVPLQTRRFARRERDDVATERSPSIRPTREGEEQRGEVRRGDEAREPAREHRGVTREDAEQLSFDLPHDHHDE